MTRYYRPTTRADALAALGPRAAPRARSWAAPTCWSGCGTTRVEPTLLVDLKGVTDLPEPIVVDRRRRRRSAPRTPWASWSRHPVVRRVVPGARRGGAHRRLGRDPQPGQPGRRTRATRRPAADTAPPLLVHGARVTIASLDGDRTASLDDFFLGPRRTLCGPGELVTRHRPAPAARRAPARPSAGSPGGAASTSRRSASPRGVDRGRRRSCSGWARSARGRCAPSSPARSTWPTTRRSTRALDELLAVATPISDVRGSREYRLATLRVLDQARGPRRGGPPGPQGDGVMTMTTRVDTRRRRCRRSR